MFPPRRVAVSVETLGPSSDHPFLPWRRYARTLSTLGTRYLPGTPLSTLYEGASTHGFQLHPAAHEGDRAAAREHVGGH
jgi:hypothetical protein